MARRRRSVEERRAARIIRLADARARQQSTALVRREPTQPTIIDAEIIQPARPRRIGTRRIQRGRRTGFGRRVASYAGADFYRGRRDVTTNTNRRKETFTAALIHQAVQFLGGAASPIIDSVTDLTANQIDNNKYVRPVGKLLISWFTQKYGGPLGWSFGAAMTGDVAGHGLRRAGDKRAEKVIRKAVAEK